MKYGVYFLYPKGHPVYTLTNVQKEPHFNSPRTVIHTLLHIDMGISEIRVTLLGSLL